MSKKKYVIESAFKNMDVQKIMQLGVDANGRIVHWTDSIGNIEELNSDYINEHYGELQDTAYQRGLEEGKKAFDLLESERNSEYQRGLNDAWEAARKISLMSPDEIENVFPGAAKYNRYNLGYSGVEAIAKLKAYENKQKDRIEVGDEVRHKNHNTTWTAVVVKREEDVIYLMGHTGAVADYQLSGFEKTGRHFDIPSILEELRNG